ncbi:hypothetical protein R5W24_000004 [Gemmata sp. JC717]|uniref:hypothetical protein n=1 Tax=Gemmata algarum TaxID=2975278 RepID=UPI0021BBAD89|nr:hypothetical protein [Gemmata algarum]MDY3550935.1 hypothetical protein [Gemmata algarum]
MRRACFVIVLGCAAASGCFLARGDRAPATSVARSLAPVQQAEGTCLEYVILERPLGDRFLDRDLWVTAQSVGAPETQVLLSENGLRVGVLAGTLPPKFQTLLESDSETPLGRRLTFANRKEEVLPTSGPNEQSEFGLLADLAGRRTTVVLKQTRCGVLVRPEPLPDQRVRVTCEPQIQHGVKREWLRPSADGTELVKHEGVPLAPYPALAFDVPLGRNEYLLIGCRSDQPDTIGAALFGVQSNGHPRQRVLVVRAHQVSPGSASELPPISTTGRRPSIAAEAGRPR